MTTPRRGSLEHVRRLLHVELRYTQAEFDKHVALYKSCTDSIDCPVRIKFLERIRTLQFALQEAGGRVDNPLQWGPIL